MVSLLILNPIVLFYSFFPVLPFSTLLNPNFTASYYQFIEHGGGFLFSNNRTFKAAITNLDSARESFFYLSVIHVPSNLIIWSANRDAPVSNSDRLSLTVEGLELRGDSNNVKWSTPPLKSTVFAMVLTDSGNLILLGKSNNSLWESFQHPTDSVVIGQHLQIGFNLSTGNYSLVVTSNDMIMQWHDQIYWKLSMDTNVYIDSNYPVDFMEVRKNGLYLVGQNGSVVIMQLNLMNVLPSVVRIARLDKSGQFIVCRFTDSQWEQEFFGPRNHCRIPFICGKIGLCTQSTVSENPLCSCPLNFNTDPQNSSSCVPSNTSCSLQFSCDSKRNSSGFSYIRLGYGMHYFAIDFTNPVKYGIGPSVCQSLCSNECACLGFFYESSSGSCFTIENNLGSVMSIMGSDNPRLGFIKTGIVSSRNTFNAGGDFKFPVVVLVVLCALVLVSMVGLIWKRHEVLKLREMKLGQQLDGISSEELDSFSIPGLPLKFTYEELQHATEDFKTQIGQGGFGAVYRGRLADNTPVAVKKMVNLGLRGKRDFCTEIAVIGNIHHLNLVRLKGFCAQRRQRLLVYEYMNRGSLDQSLFGDGPVLGWEERFDIALGTARGLAYLHGGCEQKIIHCDIKPENILLQDQFQAKISDFGLSKLLSPEQSSQFTTMRGTRGYLAPEWLTSSSVSEKTDVYSFGMVLLEIVSGRKNSWTSSNDDVPPSSSSSSSGIYFPLYALDMHEQRRYLELADPRLGGRVRSDEVEKMVRVALCCVQENPGLRPSMATVVGMLEGAVPLASPRMESLNFLRFYGHRFTEASKIGDISASLRNVERGAVAYAVPSASYPALSDISSHELSGPR